MKNRSWTSIAIVVGLPTLLVFVAWIIRILSQPANWCGTAVGAAKETGKTASFRVNDCTSIETLLIGHLGTIGLALVGCVIASFFVIVIRDLKAGADIHGPAGWSFTVGADKAAADAAQTVADSAQATADQVKES